MVILFDLDGTLTDPGLGITNSIIYTLEHFGLPVPPRQELYRFIGPPLTVSFMKYCGFDDNDAREAIRVYRERYGKTGLFENEVYDGIPELLDRLIAAGHRLGVATSKPELYSRQIIDHFGLLDRFEFVSGNTMDETRSSKEQVIRWAMENMNVSDPRDVVMVGDRKYDIIGAKTVGTGSIGVLYGYGSEDELIKAGADRVCPTVGSVFGAAEESVRRKKRSAI